MVSRGVERGLITLTLKRQLSDEEAEVQLGALVIQVLRIPFYLVAS